jgi:predicted ATPase/class 3 adenylate cyclase
MASAGSDGSTPMGTVTMLFTDIEGSTVALEAVGPTQYRSLLARHRQIIRSACAQHDGTEVDSPGDAMFAVFRAAAAAVGAALDAQRALADLPFAVRMGIHTGEPAHGSDGYIGIDVHRAARICSAAHGGQVLVSETTAGMLSGVELRDLGMHRLKDLGQPIRLFQLGEGDHPAPRTLPDTSLPQLPTMLVGRETELADAQQLLAGSRLLTLTGPAGVGKTRLAIALAAEVADDFPDGVRWLPLDALTDASLVVGAIAQDLGASGSPAEAIGDRRMLLLLDNFEHLVEAADDIAHLLGATTQLRLLVTSREPLQIAAEQVYLVPVLAREPASSLFTMRARAADPSFEPDENVIAICARLDWLPLAIELAAARAPLLNPREMLGRLSQRLTILASHRRDLPPRQRTLRSAIAWSYELLSPPQAQAFNRLAVFGGSFSLEAAESVCAAELDVLQSLVERSLVARVTDSTGTPRFAMLSTIREFAAERRAESGEASELDECHTTYFVGLVEHFAATERDEGRRQSSQLLPEIDNIRAVLERARAAQDLELWARIVGAMAGVWWDGAYFREAVVWTLPVMRQRAELSPALRLGVLRAATTFAHNTDELGPEIDLAEEYLAVAREVGDRRATARALDMLGWLYQLKKKPRRARRLRAEVETLLSQLEEPLAKAYQNLSGATAAWSEGQPELAESLAREALDIFRAGDDLLREAFALENLGVAILLQHDIARAELVLREALAAHLRVGTAVELPLLLEAIAAVRAGRDAAGAARLLGAAQALRDKSGYIMDPADELVHDQAHRMVLQHGEREAIEDEISAGAALLTDDAIRLALE